MMHHLAQAALVVFPLEKVLQNDKIAGLRITRLVLSSACLARWQDKRWSPFQLECEVQLPLLRSCRFREVRGLHLTRCTFELRHLPWLVLLGAG